MASPYPGKKLRWPSEKQQSGGLDGSDFIPYVSNLVNTFRRVPRPMAPKLIDPVTGTHISLADARRQVGEQTRAADLSTRDLDAQTGAAIRVGNLGNKFRALSDLNSKEAQINAQFGQQANMVNANIEAQNAATTNAYHDDLTNAEIAQQRTQAENIANAGDKAVMQQAVKSQNDLEREKAIILSKMYDPGVYSRLMKSLSGSGINVSGYGDTTQGTTTTTTLPSSNPPISNNTQPIVDDTPLLNDRQLSNMRKYMNLRGAYAAGGMMKVFSGDPKPPSNSSYGANFGIDPNNRTANFMDAMNNLVAKGFDPFNTDQGKATIGGEARTFYSPEFATQLGTRIKAFQTNPDYLTMTPEQRISKFYEQNHGNTMIDQFLSSTSHYGGNPGAFYQGSRMRASGGSIHIKPENRGKFTAYKKRTGKTTTEALHSKDPHVRQMANFARNAAKWHHANGGMLKPFC